MGWAWSQERRVGPAAEVLRCAETRRCSGRRGRRAAPPAWAGPLASAAGSGRFMSPSLLQVSSQRVRSPGRGGDVKRLGDLFGISPRLVWIWTASACRSSTCSSPLPGSVPRLLPGVWGAIGGGVCRAARITRASGERRHVGGRFVKNNRLNRVGHLWAFAFSAVHPTGRPLPAPPGRRGLAHAGSAAPVPPDARPAPPLPPGTHSIR